MSSVCAEHHYHYQHPLFSQDQLIIPPRKLFTRTSSNFFQQPKLFSSTIQETHKQPQQEQENYNVDEEETDDDDDDDPFATDEFRMYEFKVRRCMRSRSHDWTDCPFAHPGEKARRRDPRRFHYCGDACPDFRRGSCPRGDNCEFAHGVFECWLHPARYRTHACKDGKNCKRKVCFFAHSPRELRVLPPSSSSSSSSSCYFKQCCCCGLSRNNGSSSSNHSYDNCSPTSTLMGISQLMSSPTMSPTFMSPPSSPCVATSLVPVKSGGIGRKSGGFAKAMSNKSAVLELARSFKAKEISGNNTACSNGDYQLSWSDDRLRDDHEGQFVLSPYCTTPIKGNSIINNVSSAGSRSDIFSEDNNAPISNGGGGQFPDLDWVNELVM